MKKGVELRFQIHNILYEVYKNNRNMDDNLIKSIISKSNPKDIPFITNVCLTSMRYIFHTSKIIEMFLKKKSKVHQKILLISAITQIIFLDFKDYAVINCSVDISKKLNLYPGLINSVLKKISLEKNTLKDIPINFKDLPHWFQNETKSLSLIDKDKFINGFFKEPDLHIVFKDSKRMLKFEDEIELSSKNSGFLKNKKKIQDISLYKKGDWWVQDFSSSLPLLNIDKKLINKENIDLCSAPGGKAFQILSKNIKITLNDRSKKRLKILNENLKRLKFNAIISNENVLKISTKNKYDFIILDCPCSSIGTIRKNPEIFFKNKNPDIKILTDLQSKMLQKASTLLKNDGIILYMVCSFLTAETTDQIKNFLSRNNNFRVEDYFSKTKDNEIDILIKKNYMHTIPSTYKGYKIDGYFAIFLKKIN